MANFPATARIPCRPLSYANKDLAEPKELVVNYETGDLWVSTADGDLISLADSAKDLLMEQIKKDPSVADIDIEMPDGTTQKISVTVLENVKNIQALQESLGYIKDDLGNISFKILDQITNVDDSGNVVLKVSADDVEETENRKFLSKENIEEISKMKTTIETITGDSDDGNDVSIPATKITETTTKQFITKTEKEKIAKSEYHVVYTASVPGDGTDGWTKNNDGYYTRTISVSGIKSTDNPIVDIDLSSSTYSVAMDQLDSYAYVYRITTAADSITVYATDAPTTDFNIRLQCIRTE